MDLKKIILFLGVLSLMACQEVTHTAKPKNLIPKEKMVDILVDMAKVDAAISLNAREYEKRGAKGKEFIFKKYNIDSLQLVSSNRYYAEHFKINQQIYENVQEILQKQSDSLYALEKKKKEAAKEKDTDKKE